MRRATAKQRPELVHVAKGACACVLGESLKNSLRRDHTAENFDVVVIDAAKKFCSDPQNGALPRVARLAYLQRVKIYVNGLGIF